MKKTYIVTVEERIQEPELKSNNISLSKLDLFFRKTNPFVTAISPVFLLFCYAFVILFGIMQINDNVSLTGAFISFTLTIGYSETASRFLFKWKLLILPVAILVGCGLTYVCIHISPEISVGKYQWLNLKNLGNTLTGFSLLLQAFDKLAIIILQKR